MPIFTDYAPINYNIYDYPIQCTLINRRGVKFIPSRLMDIDKDVLFKEAYDIYQAQYAYYQDALIDYLREELNV